MSLKSDQLELGFSMVQGVISVDAILPNILSAAASQCTFKKKKQQKKNIVPVSCHVVE